MKLYVRQSRGANGFVVSSWSGRGRTDREVIYIGPEGKAQMLYPSEAPLFNTKKQAQEAYHTFLDREAKK